MSPASAPASLTAAVQNLPVLRREHLILTFHFGFYFTFSYIFFLTASQSPTDRTKGKWRQIVRFSSIPATNKQRGKARNAVPSDFGELILFNEPAFQFFVSDSLGP